ncbi:MAG: hypothetical protein U9O41_06620 [Candidatus Aerophobetes bacterium]|nr:hypothetical protein [Candidatus Aerophobetes bacterium]
MIDRKSILREVKNKFGFPVSYNQFRRWVLMGVVNKPVKKESKGRAGGVKGWWFNDCIEQVALVYWLVRDGYKLNEISWAKEVIENLNDPNIEALCGVKVMGELAKKVSNRKIGLLSRYLFVREALKKGISPMTKPHQTYRVRIHYHITSEGRKSLRVELHPIKIEKKEKELIETVL